MTPQPLDVIWWSRESPATGYWDQSDISALIAARGPHPSPWFDTRVCAVNGDEPMPDLGGAGAVVVVPGRYYSDVTRLNADLRGLRWVLLIVTGDEEHVFPWRDVEHASLQIWLQDPDPADIDGENVRAFGDGSPPSTRSKLRQMFADRDPHIERELDYSFRGQVTHERRLAARAGSDLCIESAITGAFSGTPGFTQGVGQSQYLYEMLRSKLVLCPSGPATPSTFRVYEALEAGCIPILDGRLPGSDESQSEFWALLFGDDHPLPVVHDWSTLPSVVGRILADGWEWQAARVSAWWQEHKYMQAAQLALDVERLAKVSTRVPRRVGDEVTVLITSSCIPSHPSTAVLEQTVDSVRAQQELIGAQIMVLCDGLRFEQVDRWDDYTEFRRRVTMLTNLEWPNARPVLHAGFLHQAVMLRRALAQVTTPYVLVLEHDTPLVGEIDWTGIAAWLADPKAASGLDMVRLYHEGVVPAAHDHLMIDDRPWSYDGRAPIIRTAQWSQRPHLARRGWYERVLAENFSDRARTFVEDVMHGVANAAYLDGGAAGLCDLRMGIYTPPGDMRRSGHTDGRGADPKFGMKFAYPRGETPRGAPNARRDEDD